MKIVSSKYEDIVNFDIYELERNYKSFFNNFLGGKTNKEIELKIPSVSIDFPPETYDKLYTIDIISELYFYIVSLGQDLHYVAPWEDRFSKNFNVDIRDIKYISNMRGIRIFKGLLKEEFKRFL